MTLFRWLAALLAAAALAGVAQAAPALEAYGKLPSVDLVRLSPSGARIAFLADDGVKRRLFVRQIGGDALLIQDVGSGKIRDLKWAGEDLVLVKATVTAKLGERPDWKWNARNRLEMGTVIIANLKTKQISMVFEKAKSTVTAVFGDWGERLIDGRWYGFYGALSPNYTYDEDIFKVDLETGDFKMITDSISRDASDYLIGPGGEIAARVIWDGQTRHWRVLLGAHGKDVIVDKLSPKGETGLEGVGRTPSTLVVSDSTETRDTMEEFPLVAGARPTSLFDEADTEELLLDAKGERLIGAARADRTELMLLDPALQKRFAGVQAAFKAYQTSLVSYSEDFQTLVVRTDGADDAGTYWLISQGRAEALAQAYPGIAPMDVAPVSTFKYAASDGQALEGIVTLPPGRKPERLPIVVMPHGGPIGVRDRPGFDWWAQAFASRGYAVFQPNFRGSSGYGHAFRRAGFGQWGKKMLTDISDGVSALAKAGIVDPKRACVVGASYGGYAALAGVTVQHGLYRCAVSVSGIADVGGIMAEGGSGKYNQALFGVAFAGDKDLAAISPLRRAAEADAPILLIHGRDDTVVAPQHSEAMNTVLVKAGKPVEYLVLEHEDHWLSHEVTRTQLVKASVAFVEKHNPPN